MVENAPVVVHAHLFKNAGTTLDWSLERCFKLSFCDHREDAQMRGNPAYLARFLEDNAELRALSSHWLPFPLPQVRGRRLIPLLLLRDPIERILSVYEFERRQEVDHPGTRRAKNADLQSYVSWRLDANTGPVIRNYHTRMLSGEYPGAGDAQQLGRSMALIDSLPALGLVERYEESMVLFEETLKGSFPELDLSFQRQNVRDADDKRTVNQRREAIERALGPLRDKVIAANQLDIELYEYAQLRFQKMWKEINEPAAKLRDLGSRCELLGGG